MKLKELYKKADYKELNRRYIGCELDENYFNIAKERIGIK